MAGLAARLGYDSRRRLNGQIMRRLWPSGQPLPRRATGSFCFGYSRGAFAVRSLAGVIDRVGLLRHDCATERNVTLCLSPLPHGSRTRPRRAAFRQCHCHTRIPDRDGGGLGHGQGAGAAAAVAVDADRHATTPFTAMPWGHRSGTAFMRLRWMKPAWCLSRCCGIARRAGRAMSSRSGFAARMAISAASLGRLRRRGLWPTSRWSGCWTGPRPAG